MKNIKINKKSVRNPQQGIALIITIVLTGIMLASVTVLSKEMIDEVRNSTRIDNSLIAYYAAEAGLEEALLEWRYDHDAEISQENDNNSAVDVTCTAINPCTPRTVDLTTDTRIPNITAKEYTKHYYELVMWNKTGCIITLANPTDPNPNNCSVMQPLKRDDVAEFVIPNMTQPVKLSWKNGTINPLLGDSDYRVEITAYDENGQIIPAGKFFTLPLTTKATIPISIGSGRKIIRVKPSYVNINPIGITYTEGTPISETPSIDLTINQTPTNDLIAGLVTNIESVGYYGGVARKITATIDRTSGNILSIFDYVIYSASDLIK